MEDSDYALPFEKWVKLAEERNLLLTPESYDKLIKDDNYEMVEIDYMDFLFQEDKKKYKRSKVYNPQKLYKKLKHIIRPTKVITTDVEDSIVNRCDDCNGIQEEKSIVNKYGIKCSTLSWDFYTVGNYKWLTTGNGDSTSRWMLWDDLKNMPNVYYRVKS